MRLIAGLVVALVTAVGAPAAGAQQLDGPSGTSDAKVLVIGLDGTRIDLVNQLMDEGNAPNLAALRGDGFLVPSLLNYAPPAALTLSEVGWSSISTGVWPPKHGVSGYMLNKDPGQATKNGYPDFLSRIEQVRPGLSTFLASDWENIGLHESGGPIFGDAIDTRFALAAEDTLDSYDQGDKAVTNAAADYLEHGNPDAGFVYLGVIDESAHAVGSATPAYIDAIEKTDARIGKLLSALRSRPTYLQERWLVVVTTDHGQQALKYPSVLSHGGGTELERTSFVGLAGFGAPTTAPDPRIVDVQPTVLSYLGIPVDPAWNLDGKALLQAPAIPAPITRIRRLKGKLRITVSAPQGSPSLTAVRVRTTKQTKTARSKTGARRLVVTLKGRKPRVRITPSSP